MLAFVSMPAFDPNSFTDGIGRTEWKMLSEDDHIPLLNKVAQGLYPPGSTIKPAMALAFLKQGIDPKRRVHCPGGYQLGNRYFRCDAVHGSVDMHSAIERSCNTYFWATGLITDPEQTTEMVQDLGYGEEFDLPIPSQRFGTMPNPNGSKKKYHREWQGYDSANTSIGQGYVLVNPLQLAVMPARLASGKAAPAAPADGRQAQAAAATSTSIRSISTFVRKAMCGGGQRARHRRSARSCRSTASRWPARPAPRRCFRLGAARPPVANWALRDHGRSSPSRRPTSRATPMRWIIEHGGFGALGRGADRPRFA